MSAAPLSSVTIVGGGTAGWMTAAALARHLQHTPVRIRVIASSAISTVGVGEATIPTIRNFYRGLGLSDETVISATRGAVKMALSFRDWNGKDSVFYHPFGGYGQDFGEVAFHHVFNRLRAEGDRLTLDDYCLGTALAKAGKFAMPGGEAPFYGAFFDWALHIDANLFAKLLSDFAQGLGVHHTDAQITQVNLNPENGHIQSLSLDTGETVGGDLFIDCSGFQGLLIHKTLGVDFIDYGQWLFCDRAFATQTDSVGPPPPVTEVAAHGAGWQWTIPLQDRVGRGFIYSSDYLSDEDALNTFYSRLPGKCRFDPRQLRFRPGHRVKAWDKNCVAIGLAAGFLEPLESTSISLIQTGIEKLKLLFPDTGFNPLLADEYNDMSQQEFERVRDFIILHYYAAKRDDTAFWQAVKRIELPDTLRHKIELYKARGHFVRYRWEMFHPQSWHAIYNGFDWHPERFDPAASGIKATDARAALAQMRDFIVKTTARAPTHQAFLDYCHQTAAQKIPA